MTGNILLTAMALAQAAVTAAAFGPWASSLGRRLLAVGLFPLAALAFGLAVHLVLVVGDPPYLCLARGGLEQVVCARPVFVRQRALLFALDALPLLYGALAATLVALWIVPVAGRMRAPSARALSARSQDD